MAVASVALSLHAEWRVTGQIGGPIGALAVRETLVAVGVGPRLHLYDIADPTAPREIGTTESFSDSLTNVTLSGSLAFVTAGTSGLHLVDISDPANPRQSGVWNSPGSAEAVAINGSTAFLADGAFGLQIVDISNPAAPAPIASAFDTQFAFDVLIRDHYAFVAAASAGVLIVDVSDPAHPRELGTFDTPGFARDLAGAESILYVADEWGGVRILDVSNPVRPVEIAAVDTSSFAFALERSGPMLYVANGARGLAVIDISDPTRSRIIASYDRAWTMTWKVAASADRAFLGVREEGVHIVDVRDPLTLKALGVISPLIDARYVAASGSLAFVASGAQGLRIVDFSNPSRPRERGRGDSAALGWAITTSDRLVYICEGVLPEQRLRAYDVSDPDHPVPLGSYRFDAEGTCRDLARDGSWLYATNEFGLLTFDLSNPQQPVRAGRVQFEPDGLSPDGTSGAVGFAVGPSSAFVSASVNGVKSVDITQPANLRIAGAWSSTQQIRAQIFDVAYQNGLVYASGSALVILDVRDPANPNAIGTVGLGPSERIEVRASTAFVAAGAQGLMIIDVSNPSAPFVATRLALPCYANHLSTAGERLLIACSEGGLLVVENVAGTSPLAETSHVLPPSNQHVKSVTTSVLSDRIGQPFSSLPTVAAARSVIVTSAADSGAGTLRAVLSNLQAGDSITFDPAVFPPNAPATIALLTALPQITRDGVTIDASNAGVILDGSRLTGPGAGIEIDSSGNIIKGLQITGFPWTGIYMHGSGNVIGGERTRGKAILGEANIIYRNRGGGIESLPNGNLIIGNQIGTDATGRQMFGGQRIGIDLFFQPANPPTVRINGSDRVERNVIAGNEDAEIYLHNARGNVVIGNYLGTDPTGTARVGTAFAGIASSFAADNLISGNVISGTVFLSDPGSYCNRISDNSIGVGKNGVLLTNPGRVSSAQSFNVISNNAIAGTISVSGYQSRAAETVIIGNTIGMSRERPDFGIDLSGASRTFVIRNTVYGMKRGIRLWSGAGASIISENTLLNNDDGIIVDGADRSVIQGNVIAQNRESGVVISTTTNRLRRNSIFDNGHQGIDARGNIAVPPPPRIASVTATTVAGSACNGCTIEIYSDA
ncbi:MAG TPA: right-handed parallel beta-helix repeat-containing protein, partial [Thermoanaerobaculia bacterium]